MSSSPQFGSRVTIPRLAHPLVRLLYFLMKRDRVTHQELEFRSGVLRQTFKAWRCEKTPSLPAIEATLGVFGYRLLPCPPLDGVPEYVRDHLEEIGQHFISDDETLAAAIHLATSRPGRHEGRAPRVQYHRPYWRTGAAA